MRPLVPAIRLVCLPLRTAVRPRRLFRGPEGSRAWTSKTGSHKEQFRTSSGSGPRRTRVTLLAAVHGAAALGTSAFVELSETDNSGTAHTVETRMLEVSRAEIAKTVSADAWGPLRLWRQVVLLVDLYVWEPLCTGLRLVQLSCIFVPVLAMAPCIWMGRRRRDRDNERVGALLWYRVLVKAMELAGPTFIKLGQWAASRSDIFPTEMCAVMSKLHSDAPAHSIRQTRLTVETAFGGRMDEIFDEFDVEPLGVGAIAQVYKARLRPAGPNTRANRDSEEEEASHNHSDKYGLENVRRRVEPLIKSTPQRVPSSYVAVKVLHPGVERTVRRDLRIMGFFAAVLNAVPTMEWLSLPDEVAQFGEMMRLQLDLRIEAANLTIFRRHFRDRTTASFPFPHPEFTTRNVLVEEFAQGLPLSAFIDNGGGVFQHEIASEGLDAFFRMLLLDNFVHADLHPGNIMVRFYQAARPDLSLSGRAESQKSPKPQEQPDVTEQVLARLRPHFHDKVAWQAELARIDHEGFRPQLIFIDTGLATQLNETNRRNFLDLFRAVAEFDGYRAGQLMCERCRQPEAVLDEDVFALKMQHLVLSVKSRTLALGNVRIGDILQQVLGMVRGHHVRMEGDFVNIVLSILLLEGIGRSLDPDIDLLSASLPILRQLSAQSGADFVKAGDFSMLRIWVGLETRRFLQASIEDVERCVRYDLLSPNV
ncbi:ubiquinone biosynthesis protein [Grosmannia clavigera kw1407]|uniref:Ubiquinone biosynthesis protein n=1 Tax=Grosmannia clavigera (strain kw1407 / UAMH 11150) TaxID=655863 RepID=F0XP80_GROCL|nr:ubiquinone biosynthesis protein [Grosmannia clavigera kw1407]EFX00730.1 ubiquinone biosynthesis protein [Grosmannia clavigera kw1407]